MAIRSIKFRAYDKEKKEMFPYLTIADGGLVILTPSKNEELEIMQSTGLHDKNGKEIYEGDVVRMKQMQGLGELIGEVVFAVERNCDARYWVKIGKNNVFFHDEPEVIGNIYENPEPLTKTL